MYENEKIRAGIKGKRDFTLTGIMNNFIYYALQPLHGFDAVCVAGGGVHGLLASSFVGFFSNWVGLYEGSTVTAIISPIILSSVTFCCGEITKLI